MTTQLTEFIQPPNRTFSVSQSGDGWIWLEATYQGGFYRERELKLTQTSYALALPYECYNLAFTDLEGADLNELRLGALTQGLVLGAPLIEQDDHRLAQLKQTYGLIDNPNHTGVRLGEFLFHIYCPTESPDILWFSRVGSMEAFIPFQQIINLRTFLEHHDPSHRLSQLQWDQLKQLWYEPLDLLIEDSSLGILDLEHAETDFLFALLTGVPLQKLMGWLVEA